MELHLSTGSISHDAETTEDYVLPLGAGSLSLHKQESSLHLWRTSK